MDKDLLVQNIIRSCSEAGIPPTKACKDVGIGSSFIDNIRRGSDVGVGKVAALAAHLGVTISDLVGDARASSAASELEKAASELNAEGRKALMEYAAFLASKDEYKKYAQTGLGKEA